METRVGGPPERGSSIAHSQAQKGTTLVEWTADRLEQGEVWTGWICKECGGSSRGRAKSMLRRRLGEFGRRELETGKEESTEQRQHQKQPEEVDGDPMGCRKGEDGC